MMKISLRFGLLRPVSRVMSAASVTTQSKSNRPQLTKIVATIGPKSEQYPVLSQIVDAGMRIMRINFSHATYEEADLRVTNLRKSAGLNNPDGKSINLRAVMLDTQGPEIRTGLFKGVKEVELVAGQKLTLTTDDSVKENQTPNKIWISYKKLFSTVCEGAIILLDDGAIEIRVESLNPTAGEILCTVLNNGNLGNKKGVNMPGLKVDLPAMSEKDKEDIHWGIKNDIDYIAASFTRKASDVTEIKEYVASLMEQHHPKGHPHPMVISKIESTEALENFDAILKVSDGIMVARGDLGVEIPMETLTNVQKELVQRCQTAGKPVIVATQMLESMIKNPRPTRAECTDVANAVFDGADCVMLSGESAKGKYPVQSVRMMAKIVANSEKYGKAFHVAVDQLPSHDESYQGFAYAVSEASKNIKASCIVVITGSGVTAANIARFRPHIPIVTIVPNAKAGRMLQMFRGVHPVLAPEDFKMSSPDRFSLGVQRAMDLGFCESGDNVIVVASDATKGVIENSLSMRLVRVK
jgi:pyruvate kinase